MKFLTTAILSVAALPALASAHKNHLHARPRHDARQAPALAAISTSASVAAPAASSAAASAPPASSSGGIGPSVSLLATNPTAIPLSSIVAGAPSQATHALPSSPVAGAQPTLIPAAPPLPNGVFNNIDPFPVIVANSVDPLFIAAQINPANYPPLDKPPPTDSPQVQQWIQDVKNSGVTIPNISPTVVLSNPLLLLRSLSGILLGRWMPRKPSGRSRRCQSLLVDLRWMHS